MEDTAFNLKNFAIVVTFGGIALAGWNAYFQSRISSLATLWRKWDSFQKEYNEDRLEVVANYATKKEVAEALDKIDKNIAEFREEFRGDIKTITDLLLKRG